MHADFLRRVYLKAVEMLLSMGVSETKVGVITPYRSQLRLIQQLLKGRGRVEVHTIDKYQGRDKECVVVSLVRSNANGLVSPRFNSQYKCMHLLIHI